MTQLDHRIIFFLVAVFLFSAAYFYPEALGDENEFLREFVAAPLLSVLAFITAVTFAAAISVHLRLNDLADKTGLAFDRTKAALKKSITSMIVIFALALAVVIAKPLLPIHDLFSSIANSTAITLILFDLSVMLDISRTIFKIPPASDI